MPYFPILRAGAFLCGLSLLAQTAAPPKAEGIPARAAATDYQSQAKAGDYTIAAEFTGHSVATPESTLEAEDYIVVETAVYGPPGSHLTINADNFSMRINGKKPVAAQPYGLVAKNVKDPELVPTTEQQKSKTSVGTGGNQDNTPPPPYRVPDDLRHQYYQRLQKISLPEGDRPLPQAGLIYFLYHGKADKIQSLELIYNGPAGQAKLALQ